MKLNGSKKGFNGFNGIRTVSGMLIALILFSSMVVASGVLIQSHTKEGALNDVAYYAHHNGDDHLAERFYLVAITKNPSYQKARYNLATLYFMEGDYDKAIDQLEKLIVQDPENPAYHYDLAVNMIENIRRNKKGLEFFDRALKEYKKADSLSPGFKHSRENIAVLERIKADFNID